MKERTRLPGNKYRDAYLATVPMLRRAKYAKSPDEEQYDAAMFRAAAKERKFHPSLEDLRMSKRFLKIYLSEWKTMPESERKMWDEFFQQLRKSKLKSYKYTSLFHFYALNRRVDRYLAEIIKRKSSG